MADYSGVQAMVNDKRFPGMPKVDDVYSKSNDFDRSMTNLKSTSGQQSALARTMRANPNMHNWLISGLPYGSARAINTAKSYGNKAGRTQSGVVGGVGSDITRRLLNQEYARTGALKQQSVQSMLDQDSQLRKTGAQIASQAELNTAGQIAGMQGQRESGMNQAMQSAHQRAVSFANAKMQADALKAAARRQMWGSIFGGIGKLASGGAGALLANPSLFTSGAGTSGTGSTGGSVSMPSGGMA